MDLWLRQETLPPLPEDIEDGGIPLIDAHDKLTRMRYDLDRARLIAERVRRREKLKRDMVRLSGESLDGIIATLNKNNATTSPTEKYKKGSSSSSSSMAVDKPKGV